MHENVILSLLSQVNLADVYSFVANTTFADVFGSLSSILESIVRFGFIVIAVLVGWSVLRFVVGSIFGGRKATTGAKHGLTRVHGDTAYEVKPSLRCQRVAQEHGIRKGLECQLSSSKPVAVLTFDGDIMASGRRAFARRVDEIVINASSFSAVAVVLNSPGGAVAEYGHCYAEMERLRSTGLTILSLTDTYAASGGYLMSLPAHKIIGAPFSMVGSIGVVAEFVNLHKALKNHGIEPMTFTAGERKRTVTQLNDPTDEAKEAFREGLVSIHDQFKAAVKKYRPQIDVDKVCNGDHWTAQEAMDKELGLVDAIATSQDVLLALRSDRDLVYVTEQYNPFARGLFGLLTRVADYAVDRIAARLGGGIVR